MPPAPDMSHEPWLASVLANKHHAPTSASPLLIVSSESHALSPLPILKHYINQASPAHPVILLSALIPPRKLGVHRGRSVEVIDLTQDVPGYGDGAEETGSMDDVEKRIRELVKKLGSKPVNIIIDSPATLTSNFDSSPAVFILLVNRLLTLLTTLGAPSLLVLPVAPRSRLLPLLSHPSQAHISLIPSTLLHHLQQTYALLPPTPRWYTLARSVLDREEFEEEGVHKGCVVVLVGRGKKVRRHVEGLVWGENADLRVVEWDSPELGGGLSQLKAKVSEGDKLPPTASSSSNQDSSAPPSSTPLSTFNLSLTDSQRESRSAVPVPYAHEGSDASISDDEDGSRPASGFAFGKPGGGGIYYEPDEGDDMDEDDPDEDLEF